MVNIKKHIAPVALMVILCLPSLLFTGAKAYEWVIQHKMLEELEHSQLQEITLHNEDVHWYKLNKEIWAEATLFDVHSYSVVNDSTVFRGLFDKKETELKSSVKILFEKEDKNNASRDKILAKLILQLWYNKSDQTDIQSSGSPLSDRKQTVYAHRILSHEVSIPLPPPKA